MVHRRVYRDAVPVIDVELLAEAYMLRFYLKDLPIRDRKLVLRDMRLAVLACGYGVKE